MLIAGYAHFPHGTYFLVHNSWGTGWGDGGYAWMHETTMRRWSLEVVAVDAEPLLRIPGSRRLRERAQTTCQAGLVPDSIRATCEPPCPDHSPRQDGVCAVAGQCPAGYVNLTGACVLAAPTASGKDPDTGVTWTCGPGGCSYVLPRAADSGVHGAPCARPRALRRTSSSRRWATSSCASSEPTTRVRHALIARGSGPRQAASAPSGVGRPDPFVNALALCLVFRV